ncbi:MAG: hypothetical protein O7D34_02820 [Ignavibacteria bacterium]|nr:hypothetical protein [Ignavibacteria bacterium]
MLKKLSSVVASAILFAMLGLLPIRQAYSQEKTSAVMKANVEEATTRQGYVVDEMCAKMMMGKETTMKKAAAHTKACALEEECAASGYGVFSEGNWYKFDEAGDEMALELIENTERKKGIMVDVTGKMEDEELVVASIKEHEADKIDEKADMKKKIYKQK